MHQAMHTRLAPRQPDLRPKILFVAEDVTLAHVGRMIALAQSLDAARYDVAVACGDRYAGFVRQAGLRHVFLPSMSPTYFAQRLAAGKPVHVQPLLEEQVRADLVLLGDEQPDLVVGDFRISLGISAEVAGIPYASVVNAYWSEASTLKFPIPDIPVVRLFGVGVASVFFPVILPVTLRAYLRPYNAVRRAHGLAPLASMFEMYTHADWTLYADIPELAPVSHLPKGHSYLGPVLWEPPASLPSWWNELPRDRPVVYLNVGSSGAESILQAAVSGLGGEDVTVIVATAKQAGNSNSAGRSGPEPSEGPREAGEPEGEDRKQASRSTRLPDNFFVAPYLPGTQAAARADLVICNGGSGTIYQALSQGKPVLGIPSNADQYLAMEQVVSHGAGRVVRGSKASGQALRDETRRILTDPMFAARANVLRGRVAAQDGARELAHRVDSWIGGRRIAVA